MTLGFFGDQGSGKTAALVEYMHKLYVQGWPTITNVDVAWPHINPKVEDVLLAVQRAIPLPQFYNIREGRCVLGIDEILRWANARDAMSATSKVLEILFSQNDKQYVQCVYTAQRAMQADVNLREQTKETVSSEKVGFKHAGVKYILGFRQVLAKAPDFEPVEGFWKVEDAEPYLMLYNRNQYLGVERKKG